MSILLIISSLKFEHAIPITTSRGATLNLVVLNVIILIIWSIITFLFIFFFGSFISRILDTQGIENYLLLIPVGLLFGGLYNIAYQWALKEKAFKLISRTKISQGTGLSIGKIGVGLINASPFGLITGHIIGKSAGVFSLISRFRKTYSGMYHLVSKKRLNWSFTRFRKFPLFTLPAQLLAAGGQRLPVFIITGIYGLDIVGQFGLSEMIVSIPVVLIGTAVGDVFYSEVAEKGRKNPKEILQLSNRLIRSLTLLGIAPTLVLLFFGPLLFSFVFGENWIMAGEMAQILGVLAFVRLIFTPISRVYILYERHVALLLFNGLRIIMILLSFGIAHYLNYSYLNALIFYTIGMSITYFAIYWYARVIIKSFIEVEK